MKAVAASPQTAFPAKCSAVPPAALVMAGEIEWEPSEVFPSFTYHAPTGDLAARKEAKSAAVAVKVSKAVAPYYDGGHRLVIGGVPCRIARKPSKNALAIMRQTNPFTPYGRKLPYVPDAADRHGIGGNNPPSFLADREAA